jgi:hypothetical protein
MDEPARDSAKGLRTKEIAASALYEKDSVCSNLHRFILTVVADNARTLE